MKCRICKCGYPKEIMLGDGVCDGCYIDGLEMQDEMKDAKKHSKHDYFPDVLITRHRQIFNALEVKKCI